MKVWTDHPQTGSTNVYLWIFKKIKVTLLALAWSKQKMLLLHQTLSKGILWLAVDGVTYVKIALMTNGVQKVFISGEFLAPVHRESNCLFLYKDPWLYVVICIWYENHIFSLHAFYVRIMHFRFFKSFQLVQVVLVI